MCFLNLHFGPLFWHLFRPKTTPQKVEFSTPKVKKSEFLDKKWRKKWKKWQKSEFSDLQKVQNLGVSFSESGVKKLRFWREKWRKKRGFWRGFLKKSEVFEKEEKKERNLTNFWVTTGRHHPTCWSFFSKVSWMPGFRHAHTLQQLQLFKYVFL